MADTRTTPVKQTPGDLPKTAADPGHVAVYDNDPTDGRPASALETPAPEPRLHDPVAPPSTNWVIWLVGFVLLALLLYFIFQGSILAT